MDLALIAFSGIVSIRDLITQRISNRSLLFGLFGFTILAGFDGWSIYPKSLLLSSLATPLFLKLRIGAGDLKLLLLLSFFFLPSTFAILVKFLTAIALISTILILLHLSVGRSLRSNIAFAPAICGAVIWCAS